VLELQLKVSGVERVADNGVDPDLVEVTGKATQVEPERLQRNRKKLVRLREVLV
jgi:hypothetical protein